MAPTVDVRYSIGPMFFGMVFGLILWGVTCIQTWYYYDNYKYDTRAMKILVGLVFLSDTIHQGIICKIVYTYTISYYGDIVHASAIRPGIYIEVIFNAFTASMVQCFFAYRIRQFRRDNLLLSVLGLCILGGLAVSIAYATQGLVQHLDDTMKLKHLKGLSMSINVMAVVTDLLISGSICTIFNASKTGGAWSDHILNRLMLFSINTGLVTSICACCSLLFIIVLKNNLTYISFYFIIGRFYANSFLATLNVRTRLRARVSGDEISHPKVVPFSSMSSVRFGQLGFERSTTNINTKAVGLELTSFASGYQHQHYRDQRERDKYSTATGTSLSITNPLASSTIQFGSTTVCPSFVDEYRDSLNDSNGNIELKPRQSTIPIPPPIETWTYPPWRSSPISTSRDRDSHKSKKSDLETATSMSFLQRRGTGLSAVITRPSPPPKVWDRAHCLDRIGAGGGGGGLVSGVELKDNHTQAQAPGQSDPGKIYSSSHRQPSRFSVVDLDIRGEPDTSEEDINKVTSANEDIPELNLDLESPTDEEQDDFLSGLGSRILPPNRVGARFRSNSDGPSSSRRVPISNRDCRVLDSRSCHSSISRLSPLTSWRSRASRDDELEFNLDRDENLDHVHRVTPQQQQQQRSSQSYILTDMNAAIASGSRTPRSNREVGVYVVADEAFHGIWANGPGDDSDTMDMAMADSYTYDPSYLQYGGRILSSGRPLTPGPNSINDRPVSRCAVERPRSETKLSVEDRSSLSTSGSIASEHHTQPPRLALNTNVGTPKPDDLSSPISQADSIATFGFGGQSERSWSSEEPGVV
ncbi:hypothetical protein D9758_011167 [Tetrapyrgos nigripes]|uniref:DUF6534 domain-containing protein n=1 Tax=Tetrapyrgos nigripes TaxID=182062 RepID=A0A8H5CJN7_9AGAR|nr:hypothetical protein D9758_011167 [Tetrapyrgos nigripes]